MSLLPFLIAGSLVVVGCDGGPDDPSSSEPADSAPGVYMGREIAPIRGHEMAEWFERPGREDAELPNRLVRALELDSSYAVADIGAGTGYFTFRIAPHVPHGRVFAVDIDETMLEMIRERAQEDGVPNIDTVRGRVDDPRLPEEAVDLALIVDSYHEFSHPREMLDGIFRGLRPGGRLVIVEYRGEDPTIPVEDIHRMTEAQIRLEVEASGFEWIETRDFLPQQHVVVFMRSPG